MANPNGDKQHTFECGSASASANGTTPVFYCASVNTYLRRIIFFIEDTKGMEPEEYGNLGAALSSGYSLKVWNSAGGSATHDICNGLPITTNAEVGALCYDVDLKSWTNTTNEVALARLTFEKSGEPLWLKPKSRLVIDLVDNFSGLIDHRFLIQGLQEH
jgi:hypothetical protein